MLPSYPVPYQKIELPEPGRRNIQITLKRLDKIHPEISGNKWYKLKYNIEEALRQKHIQVLTFGGAYSNHIHATAAAAKSIGLKSIGIIRGDEVIPLNPTLAYATQAGMQIDYLSRSAYRNKHNLIILDGLRETFGDFYLIPEGGTNELAIKGTKEILNEKDWEYDIICTSIGTGGTLMGILATAGTSQKVLGFSSLKGNFIHKEIQNLIHQYCIHPVCQYEIIDEYHFNGYAKFNTDLLQFLQVFTSQTNVPLDPIYTGKMLAGLMDMIQTERIPQGSNILVLHTGGLQGIRGFNLKNNTRLPES